MMMKRRRTTMTIMPEIKCLVCDRRITMDRIINDFSRVLLFAYNKWRHATKKVTSWLATIYAIQ